MLTKAQALEIVRAAVPASGNIEIENTPLAHADGRVLAEDAVADLDMPAFERSSVDGWAVSSAAAATRGAVFTIAGRVMAGEVPARALLRGEAMKVMTGAIVPEGADAVVMVEVAREDASGSTVTLDATAFPGQNVSHRAEDLREGETVLLRGAYLDPATLALLATVGKDPVKTFRVPTVCIVPTGDELVPASDGRPPPGCIRESNGILLGAQVRQVSPALRPFLSGIARDRLDAIHAHLDVGLAHDVLILSGGVSMGDLDLVGVALKARGLGILIEKVAIKPGKPLLFGKIRGAGGATCFVFGLPGNPVSSFVTFELFVRPFLLGLLGSATVHPETVPARLGGSGELKGIQRTQHVPAVLSFGKDGRMIATPVAWHGSGDLRGAADADGFIVIPISEGRHAPGSIVEVHRLPWRACSAGRLRSRSTKES